MAYTLTILRGEQPNANGDELGDSDVPVTAELVERLEAAGLDENDTDIWVLVTPADEDPGELRNVIATVDVTTYTVEIQASNADGSVWQAVAPAENVTVTGHELAQDIAINVAYNQAIADGDNWRVMVWDGANADTDNRTAAATAWGQDIRR